MVLPIFLKLSLDVNYVRTLSQKRGVIALIWEELFGFQEYVTSSSYHMQI